MTDPAPHYLTFLFTDVVGSTALWERDEPTMRRVAARHDALAEAVIAEFGGYLVRPRGEGDGLFIIFERAEQAVCGAGALQQRFLAEAWDDGTPLKVRMALHTGVAEFRDGDYYGRDVNRCSSLRATAHGGQIVLSRATLDLLCGAVPPPYALRDLRLHRIKGLERAEQIFQLLHPHLPDEFPPLQSLDPARHNLPILTKSFLGRDEDVAYLAELSRTAPLLTLTGPGGAGKTQMALHIGAEQIERFEQGVWLTRLESLREPDRIPQAIMAALGVPEEPRRPALDTLRDFLAARRLCLILDNCEHLAPACAEVVDALLNACPHLRILATSQAPLGWDGEQRVTVTPLALPHLAAYSAATMAQALPEYAATRLFVERAKAAKPDFTVTPRSAGLIARLCVELDGNPLLIELAAGRVAAISLDALLKELPDVLNAEETNLPERQRSDRAMMRWSASLLPDAPTRLLRRLSVFAEDFTQEAAQTVCADSDETAEVREALALLARRSLTQVEEQEDGAYRYRLTGVTRRYAVWQCEAAGETAAFRARHAAYFLELAERLYPLLGGQESNHWIDVLAAEQANFRAALQHTEDPLYRLRVAGVLHLVWTRKGQYQEGRDWLEPALANAENAPPDALRRALNGAGILAWRQEDMEAAERHFRRGLDAARRRKDRREVAKLMTNLGLVHAYQERYAEARPCLEESVKLYTALKDDWRLIKASNNLAMLLTAQKRYAAAYKVFARCADAERPRGESYDLAVYLHNLGETARYRKKWGLAESHFREVLPILKSLNHIPDYGEALAMLVLTAIGQKQYERAALLMGAAETVFAQSTAPRREADCAETEKALRLLRRQLGAARCEDCLQRGRAFTDEEAFSFSMQPTEH